MSTSLLPFRNNLPEVDPQIPFEGLKGQYGTYIAEPALVHAANTALGLEMPLLLTGWPGCGKSDFAWVAAKALGHDEPLRFHVRSDTRARDLLYSYDALVRFGDMQHGRHERAQDPRHYVSLRPLGAALMSPGRRPVVLIDEIDKAPRDLPNDLLHEIDEGRFEIPEIGELSKDAPRRIWDRIAHLTRRSEHPQLPKGAPPPICDRMHTNIELKRDMKRPPGQLKPLVVITSNAERQLPEAFLRRCIFFPIPPPNIEQLIKIAVARFPNQPSELMKSLAAVFHAFRESHSFVKTPTTAEMLNWIDALARLYDPSAVQAQMQDFVNALIQKAKPKWNILPALGCLLKMEEDFEIAGARVHA